MQFLFAATETTQESAQTSGTNLFSALGIDWQLLLVQGAAFLILVFLLGKFVYPVLVKSIEDRRAAIEAGMEEAKQSQAALEKAEAKVADMLAEARKEADDILARSQQEASTMVSDAEAKAKTRADQMVESARAQLQADVAKARAALKKDTVELVALATEKVVHEKLDERKDAALIHDALGEKG
jgi:F-type H+-transporting ATPase subunit b